MYTRVPPQLLIQNAQYLIQENEPTLTHQQPDTRTNLFL